LFFLKEYWDKIFKFGSATDSVTGRIYNSIRTKILSSRLIGRKLFESLSGHLLCYLNFGGFDQSLKENDYIAHRLCQHRLLPNPFPFYNRSTIRRYIVSVLTVSWITR
jgi:hypothetical protein